MSDALEQTYPRMHWPLEPDGTVLVVIDQQNDFLHPEGWYAQQGVDISHLRRSIEPTRALVEAARSRRTPIVWTQHGFRDAAEAGLFLEMRPTLSEGGLRTGTWGYEILDGLGAQPGDRYVHKNRLSAFFATNLELMLRGLDARTVIFAGVLTNQCVAATSKDAYFRDMKPIVVEEATGTTMAHLHEPAIEMIAVGWGEVRSLAQTLRDLEALPLSNR